eukprot:362567-Amphidinium_carterae.1
MSDSCVLAFCWRIASISSTPKGMSKPHNIIIKSSSSSRHRPSAGMGQKCLFRHFLCHKLRGLSDTGMGQVLPGDGANMSGGGPCKCWPRAKMSGSGVLFSVGGLPHFI